MSSSVGACLSIALRSVRESMLFDSQNRQKEAFCQYLSNVMYICGVLKDEAWEKELKDCHTPETIKLFKLSSQCLERAQDLLSTTQDDQETTEGTTQSTIPLRKTSQEQGPLLSPGPTHVPSNSPMPSVRVHHTPPASPKLRNRRSVPFIDEARRGNTQLLSAYRARMERREKQVTGSSVRRKADVTSLNLSVFRKMAENLEIAKARQQSLERKKAERQQRLREEADRRMGPSSLLTTHDQIKKEIYVKVLEFEQDSMWLVSLRDRLRSNPEDAALIQDIISKVLGTKEHPLTKCLYSYQVEVHNQLTKIFEQAGDIITQITTLENTNFEHQEETGEIQPKKQTQEGSDEEISFGEELNEILESSEKTSEEAINIVQNSCKNFENFLTENQEQEYKEILVDVVNNVQSSLEIVHSLFLLVYEEFSSAAGEDLCLASVELTFFRPLWPLLLNLYRIANYRKEARLVEIFAEYRACTPAFMNVPVRLCLDEQVTASAFSTAYPYQSVVEELQSLTKFRSPLEKLECIVRTNRVIVECVEDYYESKGKPRNSPETVIGCDDLLPIISYVIVKSQLPQLVSECKAMEDFISEGYLMGEEGYSLTTFQTALAYLESLPEENDLKPAKEAEARAPSPPPGKVIERHEPLENETC